jgi:hypothetical protein
MQASNSLWPSERLRFTSSFSTHPGRSASRCAASGASRGRCGRPRAPGRARRQQSRNARVRSNVWPVGEATPRLTGRAVPRRGESRAIRSTAHDGRAGLRVRRRHADATVRRGHEQSVLVDREADLPRRPRSPSSQAIRGARGARDPRSPISTETVPADPVARGPRVPCLDLSLVARCPSALASPRRPATYSAARPWPRRSRNAVA